MTTSVLIVGDTAFTRLFIRKRLIVHPEITVVGDIANNTLTVESIRKLKPDIILLDIDVPTVAGLEKAQHLMLNSVSSKVIVLLNLSIGGAEIALKALEYGAVDFIHKESSLTEIDMHAFDNALLAKIRQWSTSSRHHISTVFTQKEVLSNVVKNNLQPKLSESPFNTIAPKKPKKVIDLVLIGISTGGPLTLLSVLGQIKSLNCPLVIAQHMPSAFTKSLSIHLRNETGLNVVEGSHALPLEPGMIVIARGGIDSCIQKISTNKLMLVEKKDERQAIHPSVDILFQSAAQLPIETLAIVMTGMGNDGLVGGKKLKEKGMTLIAQNPDSCIVAGMPSSLIDANLANFVLKPEKIGELINDWCGGSSGAL